MLFEIENYLREEGGGNGWRGEGPTQALPHRVTWLAVDGHLPTCSLQVETSWKHLIIWKLSQELQEEIPLCDDVMQKNYVADN